MMYATSSPLLQRYDGKRLEAELDAFARLKRRSALVAAKHETGFDESTFIYCLVLTFVMDCMFQFASLLRPHCEFRTVSEV